MKNNTNYERYGNYIINRNESLGSGTFGNVWKGYMIVNEKGSQYLEPVAIKESFQEPQNMQEVNTLQILRHPHIIRYIDYKLHGSRIFMIMELCDGGTLEDLLMQIPEGNHHMLLYYYEQIISGIKFMYSKNILHRDLKPSNILLRNNKIKIADFGTSKFRSQNELKTLVGTPLFSSPEILGLSIGQDTSYTQKADIWSLGLILYLMFNYNREKERPNERLKASLPWVGKNNWEILKSIRHDQLEFKKPNIPQEVKDAIRGMLEINVNLRLDFNQIFALKIFSKNHELLQNDSKILLQLSVSYHPQEEEVYDLTLQNNSETYAVSHFDKKTIDWELMKLLEIKDIENYEQEELKETIEFYNLVLEELEGITGSGNFQLTFQLQKQLYKLLFALQECEKCFHSRLYTKMEGSQSSTSPESKKMNALLQKHYSRRSELQSCIQKDQLRPITQNLSIQFSAKENNLLQYSKPDSKLSEEIKQFLKKNLPKHEDKASADQDFFFLFYDLFTLLAFEYSWKAKSKSQLKSNSKLTFIERYVSSRQKVQIKQIVDRVHAASKVVRLD